MGIEEVLLEYHKATNQNWSYQVVVSEILPQLSIDITTVTINGTDINFWEIMDVDKKSSTIYWMQDSGELRKDFLGSL